MLFVPISHRDGASTPSSPARDSFEEDDGVFYQGKGGWWRSARRIREAEVY